MYRIIKEFIRFENAANEDIKELKEQAKQYVDGTVNNDKIAKIKGYIEQSKRETRQKLDKKYEELKHSVELWSLPKVEDIEDLKLLEANVNITEEQVLMLQDKHKSNNVMLEALYQYALDKRYMKPLKKRYATRNDKLEAIDYYYKFYQNALKERAFANSDHIGMEGYYKRTIMREHHEKEAKQFSELMGSKPITIAMTDEELQHLIQDGVAQVKKDMEDIRQDHNKAMDRISSYSK